MIILGYLLLSILLILLLTSKLKIHPTISLFIGSLFLGLLLKMNLNDILEYIFQGFSNAIKSIGLIIIFSTIIGQFLKKSNSIKKFGDLILYNFQDKTLISINLLGLFLGTVVFCDSGFLILNGISKSIASTTNYSLTSLNLSLSGGLYASHTLVPPTPGPLAAINNLNGISMIGDIMLLSIVVSIPASLISFIYARKTFGKSKGDLLVLGWGGTHGAIRSAVESAQESGYQVAHIHLRYLNPLPENLGGLLLKYNQVLIPELNLGQLSMLMRSKFLIDAISLSKVQGKPFNKNEILNAIKKILKVKN